MTRTLDAPPAKQVRDARASEREQRVFLVLLVAVAVVALAIRVWWVLAGYSNYKVNGDALYYHQQAWTLADGKGFIFPYDFYVHHTTYQSAANPPLYSLYLAAVTKLGFRTVTDHRLASCLLGTGAVVNVGLLGRYVVNARVGIVAALIAAVYPNMWINDGMLLSEPMTLLLIPLVLLGAYAFWRRRTLQSAVWLGLALGLAALSRGEVVFLAPLLVVPLLYGMHALAVLTRVKLLVVVAVSMLLLVGPWVGYNLTRFKDPVFMTDHWGTVMKAGSCDRAYYGKFAGWYWFCQKTQPAGDYSERDVVLRQESFDYMREHIDRLPLVMLMRTGRLWDVYKPGQTIQLNATLEGRTRTASRWAWIAWWLVFPFAVGGTVVLRRRRIPITPILAPVVVVTIAAATTYGVLRYRVSAEPGIILAAAVSAEVLWSSLVGRRRNSPTVGAPAPAPSAAP